VGDTEKLLQKYKAQLAEGWRSEDLCARTNGYIGEGGERMKRGRWRRW